MVISNGKFKGKLSSAYGLLNQKLTDAQKIDEYGSMDNWYIANAYALDNSMYKNIFRNNAIDKYGKMKKCLDVIERGLFDTQDYIKTTNKSLGSLVTEIESFNTRVPLEHHDIISKNVKALEGEEIGRPFRFFAYDVSGTGITYNQDTKLQLLQELMSKDFAMKFKDILEANGVETSANPPSEVKVQYANDTLKSVQEILNYKKINNLAESSANALLKYLIQNDQLDRKFIKGFSRYIASGQEIYRAELINGKPTLRGVNPLFLDYDLAYEDDDVENASYYREYEYDTIANVIRKYWDHLEDEDIKYLEQNKGQWVASSFDPMSSRVQYGYTVSNITFIRVARFEWKGLRKIGIKTFYNEETGDLTKEVVDEKYKKKKGENIDWYWINWTQKATRLADNVFIDLGPLEWQIVDLDNLDKPTSSYVGIRQWYSLGDRMLTYQYLYNLTWFNLKLTIARSAGKALLIDVAQIPKEEGWDLPKWLHFLKSFGIVPINSLERNDEGDKSTFNQFQSLDLSASNEIAAYINQLRFIKEELEDCTGITRQRLGQTQATETLGGIERSVSQSSAITESYFYIHADVKKRALQLLLDVAKFTYKSGDKLAYILDDETRAFIEMSDEMRFSNYGIYVSNSNKDKQTLEFIKQSAQQYLQQGQIGLDDLAKVISTDSLAQAVKFAEEGTNKVREIQAQQAQQQTQAIQEQTQVKQQEVEMKRYEIDANNATKIEVAKINASARSEDSDGNNNEVNDYVDQQKLNLEVKKHEDNMMIEKAKLEQGNDKLKLDEKKINNTPKSPPTNNK